MFSETGGKPRAWCCTCLGDSCVGSTYSVVGIWFCGLGVCSQLVDKIHLENLITHPRSLLIKEDDLMVGKKYDLYKRICYNITAIGGFHLPYEFP
jgi:hypothetical protein